MAEGEGDDDMLSNLPDDILLSILDRLHVCEAARTGVMSRRWRQLPAMLSRLVINVWDFIGAPECDHDEMVRANADVVEATKSIMACRDSTKNTIRFLRISFFLTGDDHVSIGHALAHAMATRKVEIAQFAVMTERDDIYCNDNNQADYGRQFMLFFDACPDAFDGLTRLDLENLRFGESNVPNVLSTCKLLKHLGMFSCDLGYRTVLQVEHSQIGELTIMSCSFERVELSSLSKITQFIFEDWISFQNPVSFGFVPLLDVVSLTNVGLSRHKLVRLSKFLQGTTSVRNLMLGFHSEKIWIQPECVDKRLAYVFQQIRFVNLTNIS
jgi:hypothetical protein